MKKIFAIILAVSVVIGVPASTYALTKASENQYVVRQDEVINDDLFVAAESVTIEGIVNGDVYAVGNRVTIRGTVNGDVIVGASLVEVSGVVRDDLRVGASTVTVNSSAKIGDSFSAAGSDISVSADSIIGGGVQVAGSSVDMNGSVGRGILAGTSSLRINGPVKGNIQADSEKLNFGDKADIKGSVNYTSTREAVIDEGAVLASKPEMKKRETAKATDTVMATITSKSIGFAMTFVTGAVIILVAKKHVKQIAQTIGTEMGKTLGLGLVVMLAGVPAFILIAMTFIGIPLALIMLTLWIIALIIGKIFTAVAVGSMLLKRNNSSKTDYLPNAYGALAIGLALYYLATLVPFIGFFVAMAATAMGLGGLAIQLQSSRQTVNPKAVAKK
ncbi:hypothetical protein KBB17_03015 [Candidatus Saccharibacteria bacterium]|jgi:cytoskeletal protein CcmA (bactofilin family)|nr:hypothetical protein [Candidatus Saccharibacteria bacterium]MBP9131908.1 hypothetical protein [Candidatus Saccharibacteria bacterium]